MTGTAIPTRPAPTSSDAVRARLGRRAYPEQTRTPSVVYQISTKKALHGGQGRSTTIFSDKYLEFFITFSSFSVSCLCVLSVYAYRVFVSWPGGHGRRTLSRLARYLFPTILVCFCHPVVARRYLSLNGASGLAALQLLLPKSAPPAPMARHPLRGL